MPCDILSNHAVLQSKSQPAKGVYPRNFERRPNFAKLVSPTLQCFRTICHLPLDSIVANLPRPFQRPPGNSRSAGHAAKHSSRKALKNTRAVGCVPLLFKIPFRNRKPLGNIDQTRRHSQQRNNRRKNNQHGKRQAIIHKHAFPFGSIGPTP